MFYSCIRCCSSSILKNTIPRNSHFVLLSGGIDSAVLLAHQKDIHGNACGIFFDYCQRAKDIELLASKKIANDFDCHLVELSLHSLGKEFQNINKLHVPLPNRNLILLSIALSYIHTVGGTSLSIGINKDDLQKDYSMNHEFYKHKNPCDFETDVKLMATAFTLASTDRVIISSLDTDIGRMASFFYGSEKHKQEFGVKLPQNDVLIYTYEAGGFRLRNVRQFPDYYIHSLQLTS